MRFTIASAALLADALSKGADASMELHEMARELLTSPDPSETLEVLHKAHPTLMKHFQDLRRQKKPLPSEILQSLKQNGNNKGGNNSILKNFQKVECDPYAQTLEEDADVGVLSCSGDFQYCAESAESALGGYCTTLHEDNLYHRDLQQQNATAIDAIAVLCNLDENSESVTCETCTIDEAAYTGEFSCVYTQDCMKVPGLCGDNSYFDFCGTDNIKATINGMDYYNRESCFDVTTPIPFSYCDRVLIDGGEVTCEQSINGVTCNSCILYYNAATGGSCQAFDCSNTDLGVKGNDCSVPLIGALTFGYLYSKLPCPDGGCSLCGDGRVMSNNGNMFETDGLGSTNCFSFQMNALTGKFAENDYCTSLTENVEEPCGCVDGGSNLLAPGNPTVPGAAASASGASVWSTVTAAGATAAVSASMVLLSGGLDGLLF